MVLLALRVPEELLSVHVGSLKKQDSGISKGFQ